MTPGIVIVGAGGHAKVCIELLHAMQRPLAFCIGGDESEDFCLDVPVLRGDAHLARLRDEGFDEAFIAIGSNALRQKLAGQARALGFRLVNAISPKACVSPTARLGQGIAVMVGAVINASATLADMVIINTLASVDHDGDIGEAAHIGPHCALAGNVKLGERSFLGVGSKVIPGIEIGGDVVAGAGSVIVANVQEGARIKGVPAKPY